MSATTSKSPSQAAENETPSALSTLKAAYGEWWDLLQSGGQWDWDLAPSTCDRLAKPLSTFGAKRDVNANAISNALIAIAKGKELIETALAWENPVVGGRGNQT